MVGCLCVIQLTFRLNFFVRKFILLSVGGGLNAHNRDAVA